jgi:hypothetical protein
VFRCLLSLTIAFATFVVGPVCAATTTADNLPTAEQIAETVVAIYGGRIVLTQIRRNGLERGKVTRSGADGRTEESTYERRFIRGENSLKDKIRLDQKMPSAEYALVYGDGHAWGMINGSAFTPRQDATASFLSQMWHGVDALLRYKENGSTIKVIGKEKHMGVETYVFDLTDKDKRVTRYYISSKTFKILWLEYEETPPGGAAPVKYVRKFYDYRVAQQTLVPYRTVLYEDGKQVQETHVSTVTYGVRLEDSLFQNPDVQTTASQP